MIRNERIERPYGGRAIVEKTFGKNSGTLKFDYGLRRLF